MMQPLPAQVPLGTSTLLIGVLVFVAILAAILIYFFLRSGGLDSDPWDQIAEAAADAVDDEDADALALIPYSDGPLVPKPAIYDRELLGGKGGYRTSDGERIYVDGQGKGKFSLDGTDVILAIDPTEHAAAADPLKAWIAHKNNNVGEWIKVDRENTLIEAGEALKSLDGVEPAMETPKSDGLSADGGYVSEVHEHAHTEGMPLEDAKSELEQAGLLHKIVDVAPPSEVVIDEETGEPRVESSSHVGIDVSDAADLLPKKTNTTAWQVLEEKARQEGRDEDKLMQYMMYGIAIGAVVAGISAVLIALVLGFT